MSAQGLSARNLGVGYGGRTVIEGLSLALEPGEITALVGPNGSGKSTLLKALSRLVPISGGAVLLDGQAIHQAPTREVALALAVLPQGATAPEGLTVRGLVEQGRFPHLGAWRRPGAADRAAVEEALAITGLEAFAGRPLDTLSGGERQRAWIALTLAQGTPHLLLDEPTTYLDIGHQIEVLELLRRLNAEKGITIVMVLHDLNQAARYSDRMIVLQGGAVAADGAPIEVLTARTLHETFGVEATIVADPVTGAPAFFAGRTGTGPSVLQRRPPLSTRR